MTSALRSRGLPCASMDLNLAACREIGPAGVESEFLTIWSFSSILNAAGRPSRVKRLGPKDRIAGQSHTDAGVINEYGSYPTKRGQNTQQPCARKTGALCAAYLALSRSGQVVQDGVRGARSLRER